MDVFQGRCSVDYPREQEDGGGEVAQLGASLTACIHPTLEGKDFHPIEEGQPIFLTLDGQSVGFERKNYKLDAVESTTPVYAFFVNEAAYYEKGIAFMLVTKHEHRFPVMPHKQLVS